MSKKIVLVLAVLVCGCHLENPRHKNLSWKNYYEELQANVQKRTKPVDVESRLTVSCQDIALREFLRFVCDEGGVSVVCDESLDDKIVNVEVTNEPVSLVLGVVARRLGVQVTRVGRLFYIGELRPEDKGVLVRRVRGLAYDDLQKSIEILSSEFGRMIAYPSGLVVIGDRVEVLERINELLDQVERVEPGQWVVQYYLVSLTDTLEQELGFDATPTLEMAYTFASTSIADLEIPEGGVTVTGGLSAILRAVREVDKGAVVAEPLFVVSDGQTAKLTRAESIPVPKKTVSDEGTVTTSDYEEVEAGLIVEVTIREMSPTSISLTTSVELSEVARMVEEKPVIIKREYQTVSRLESGGVYLLGSLESENRIVGRTGAFGLVDLRQNRNDTVQIWCRVLHIGSDSATERAVREASEDTESRNEIVTEQGPVIRETLKNKSKT